MAVDDSFKKQGAVPFKWEIKPGVPKVQSQPPPRQQHHQKPSNDHHSSSPRLKPPPSGSFFHPTPELRTRSFRSAPRSRSYTHSERWRFDRPLLSQPETVSPGCFLAPLLIRKKVDKKRSQKPGPESETDYTSDLETLARWSVSSRKSLSPFHYSPSSSSYSSRQSSPRPVSDAEWAGFGLF